MSGVPSSPEAVSASVSAKPTPLVQQRLVSSQPPFSPTPSEVRRWMEEWLPESVPSPVVPFVSAAWPIHISPDVNSPATVPHFSPAPNSLPSSSEAHATPIPGALVPFDPALLDPSLAPVVPFSPVEQNALPTPILLGNDQFAFLLAGHPQPKTPASAPYLTYAPPAHAVENGILGDGSASQDLANVTARMQRTAWTINGAPTGFDSFAVDPASISLPNAFAVAVGGLQLRFRTVTADWVPVLLPGREISIDALVRCVEKANRRLYLCGLHLSDQMSGAQLQAAGAVFEQQVITEAATRGVVRRMLKPFKLGSPIKGDELAMTAASLIDTFRVLVIPRRRLLTVIHRDFAFNALKRDILLMLADAAILVRAMSSKAISTMEVMVIGRGLAGVERWALSGLVRELKEMCLNDAIPLFTKGNDDE